MIISRFQCHSELRGHGKPSAQNRLVQTQQRPQGGRAQAQVREYRSTGIQQYKSTRVQEYGSKGVQESTRVQEYRSTEVQEFMKESPVSTYIYRRKISSIHLIFFSKSRLSLAHYLTAR